VEANNAAALALYRRAGFQDVYEYSYREPASA
jgi:ribosomal protein S18 acetylase RimI-like enzyme